MITLAILILGLVALIGLRVPVAIALLVPGVVYLSLSDIGLRVAIQQSVGGINSFPLLAVPLFILVGNLANASGVSERLFDLAESALGAIKGSLGYVNVAVSTLFSWMSGSAIADVAGLGSMQVPTMVRRGYDGGFSVGVTAASALVGPLMPPSITAIIYAVTAELSIGALFAAGILPAFLLAALLCVNVFLYGRRNPGLQRAPARLREVGRAAVPAAPPLVTPVIVLGGILGGVFTPTEAAGVAALYLFFLAAAYRKLSPKLFRDVMVSSARTTAGIMIIVGGAAVFGWILRVEGAGALVSEGMQGLTESPIVFLITVNIVLLVVGTFLEPASGILILVPILHPLAVEFGIEPVHFAIIVLLNLSMGLLTPPLGIILFVMSSVSGVSLPAVIKGVVPFFATLLVVLLIITYVPWISLAIPRALGLV